jgi:hypothetical protein
MDLVHIGKVQSDSGLGRADGFNHQILGKHGTPGFRLYGTHLASHRLSAARLESAIREAASREINTQGIPWQQRSSTCSREVCGRVGHPLYAVHDNLPQSRSRT